MTTATVVGSGPNGLAAAVTLAMAGVEVTVLEMADKVGGGTRTSELTLPGVLHDDCSAVHPVGAASPFFASLDLEAHGLTWKHPEIDAVQPLDNGNAGVLHRSITDTAAGLGVDGGAWQRFFGPLSDRFDDLTTDFFRPLLHMPRHPITLTKFGLNALAPASLTARRFRTPEARALFSGVAAHALYPLTRPTTSAVGVMMIAAGHKYGWPVAEGGSRAISDALVSVLTDHGGKVETGIRVTRLQQIPPSDIVMLDLSPTAVADIAGDALPKRVARPYRRWRYGPALSSSTSPSRTVFRGPTRVLGAPEPFISVGPSRRSPRRNATSIEASCRDGRSSCSASNTWPTTLARRATSTRSGPTPMSPTATPATPARRSSTRSNASPRGSVNASSRAVRSATQMPTYNPNYVGGDIVTGSNDPGQVALRPRVSINPYWTGIDGVYICSAATPPGAGVHGMGGYNAAQAALHTLAKRP